MPPQREAASPSSHVMSQETGNCNRHVTICFIELPQLLLMPERSAFVPGKQHRMDWGFRKRLRELPGQKGMKVRLQIFLMVVTIANDLSY